MNNRILKPRPRRRNRLSPALMIHFDPVSIDVIASDAATEAALLVLADRVEKVITQFEAPTSHEDG